MYQPNDYEQCFIAAGIISIEAIDEDYQEYLKSTHHHEEQMTHSEWKSTLERMAELNAFYKAEIEPLYAPDAPPMSYQEREKESNYWREVSWLECALGY
jgi:hypothetical protein